jgi:hypothetical protein
MWFGEGFKIDKDSIKKNLTKEYSQDNMFYALLGLMELETWFMI